MKKANFTIKQINEVLNVAVDVQNGDVRNSIQSAKTETDRSVGSGTDRNYVIAGDEINEYYDQETKEDKDPFNASVNKFFEMYDNDPEMESIYTNGAGQYNMNEVMDMLSDLYSEYTDGEILSEDKWATNLMKKIFIQKADFHDGLQQIKIGESKHFTKKQLEEARLLKIKENGIHLTKKELKEKLNKLN